MRTAKMLAGLFLLSSLALGAQAGQLWTCTASGPVTVGLPWTQAPSTRVWVKGAAGQWQQLPVQLNDQRLILQLDPAVMGGGTMLVVIDPPAGLVLNDNAAPQVVGLKADGKRLPLQTTVDLGTSAQSPRSLLVAVRDAANALDRASLKVSLDGQALTGKQLRVETPSRREARVTAQLPEVEYGRHEILLTVADNSPQANRLRLAVRFQRLDTTNLALASLGSKITVDSCFEGYPSTVCLNDGVTALPGDTCPNELTWASSEADADHWVQVEFAKPVTLREATFFWAAYTNAIHTPKYFEVQVPEGTGWRTLYKSPDTGEKPQLATTAKFCPVTTDRLRLFVPAGKGSESRPRLLWLAEIQAR